MKAYLFPGQGAQFTGMGKDLYEQSDIARVLFEQANEILGFSITDVMFNGSEEDLRQTKITQPAIFLHSVITARVKMNAEDKPSAVAGHSLGEFSALVACGALKFEEALRLVYTRAMAMQKACEATEGTMVAAMSPDMSVIEQACAEVNAEAVVVPANYNTPGQLVVSGSVRGVQLVSAALEAKGVKIVPLSVGGAFHSPLMQSAQVELQAGIEAAEFTTPFCPIYQNVNAQPTTDIATIRTNLIQQLTGAVRWQQTIENMLAAGIEHFVEVGGKGGILLGMVKRINRKAVMEQL